VDLGFGHLLQFGLGDQTVLNRLGLDPLGVEPSAVVGDADDDVAAFMIGERRMVPCSGLPAAERSAGVSRPWSAELRTMCVKDP